MHGTIPWYKHVLLQYSTIPAMTQPERNKKETKKEKESLAATCSSPLMNLEKFREQSRRKEQARRKETFLDF
jgi:hypothetical protein